MKRTLATFTMGALFLATTASADKYLTSLNNPLVLSGTAPPPLAGPLSAAFSNGVSKGTAKIIATINACKLSVKLSGTTLPDSDGIAGSGDEVICLIEANAAVLNSPVGLVVRGEASGGTVSIKADLYAEGFVGGAFCNNVAYDLRSTCYEADAAYAPAFAIPFPSDATQGIMYAYPPRPASGLIVTEQLR